jgi:branched-chain amino acid transport system ATP-binding protein
MADGSADMALELTGVTKRYGGLTVLGGVDLRVRAGECHAIIGPNGAGKSTLFHVASGRVGLSGGSIRMFGRDVTGLAPHERVRLGLGRSFQITNLFPKLTVFENARCALMWAAGERYQFWRGLGANAALRQRVEALLADVGLEHRAGVRVSLLSYAEQRALEIGLAAASGSRILLLDEPTAGMSQAETERAIALIKQVSATRTVLIVEHDMKVVFDVADRISVLMEGRVIASGSPEAIQASPVVRSAYLGAAGHA